MSRLSQPVLWVDPGGMTGLATYHPQGGFWCDELDFTTTGRVVNEITHNFAGRLLVGWERFTIGPGTHKNRAGDAHSAIEAIGVVRFMATIHECPLLTPAAPGDRDKATMAMLKALGWWKPGKDDAQSAAQHLLAWMLRSGCVPDREASLLAALR